MKIKTEKLYERTYMEKLLTAFIFSDFKQRPIHECWVTCKRGRSFKKPEYRTDCFTNNNG